MVRIGFNAPFSERIGGTRSVDVSATTVESALRALTDAHPELVSLVWRGGDAINPMIAVFLNDSLLGPDELGASIKLGDKIEIIQAVSGG